MEAVARPPVWLMRQAGRHLPEYAALREKHPFMEMLTDEKLIVEVSLQPWRRYGVDGVIVFSDILLLPKTMGMNLMFIEGQGPKFEKLIASEKDLESLKPFHPKEVPFLTGALKKIKKEIGDKAALIGFAGSPWTVASYMIQDLHEGWIPSAMGPIPPLAGARGVLTHRRHPPPIELLENLLKRLTQETIAYLKAQIEAEVDVIQIFDSWGGTLSAEEYMTWSGNYIKEIVDALRDEKMMGGGGGSMPPERSERGYGPHHRRDPSLSHHGVPIILYIKDSKHLLPEMLATGADVISVGWETSLEEAKKLAKGKAAIQGNFNPHILMQATPDEIREATLNMLETMKDYPGYIANLGHGVLPKTPVENVTAFVEAVKSRRLSLRGA